MYLFIFLGCVLLFMLLDGDIHDCESCGRGRKVHKCCHKGVNRCAAKRAEKALNKRRKDARTNIQRVV